MAEQEQKQQERQELLEIYKLHADLAERVSQRRDGVNRLYFSLMVSALVFASTILRFGPGLMEGTVVDIMLLFIWVVGSVLAVNWFYLIRSYDKLNDGQYCVLRDLEHCLAYPFITEQFKREPKGRSPYRELSYVGAILPWIWGSLFTLLAIFTLAGRV